MKHSEQFAVNQWLSWCADGMTYSQIIDVMKNSDIDDPYEYIQTWAIVQNLHLHQVADLIEDTCLAFETAVKHMGQA
jgi:hypothetical protein